MLWKSEWSSGSHHIKPPPSQNGYSGKKFILIILAAKWLVRYSTSRNDLCLPFCIYPSSMLYSVRIVMITYKCCKCCNNPPPPPPLLCSEGWRGLWSCCCCWPWSSSWCTMYMVQARDTDGDGILDAGKTTDGPTWVDSVFKVYNTNVVNTNVTD